MRLSELFDKIFGESDLDDLLAQVDEVSKLSEGEIFEARDEMKNKDVVRAVEVAVDWLGVVGKVLLQRVYDSCFIAVLEKFRRGKNAHEVLLASLAKSNIERLMKGSKVPLIDLRYIGAFLELLGFSEDDILMCGCLPTGWWLRVAFDPIIRQRLKQVFTGVPYSLYLLDKDEAQYELSRVRSGQDVFKVI